MRDMTRELLIRASRPLHMTRAYQTPRFDPRILRSPIFPREFTPMGVDPDPYLPLSIFFSFPSLASHVGWNEKEKIIDKSTGHLTSKHISVFKERLSFWRRWAGNRGDDFLMGNFWEVLYGGKMATGVQVRVI